MVDSSRSRIFRDGLLEGQVCVVSGAGSGLGRETALELARLGAVVIGSGRREEPLAETAALAAGLPGSFGRETMDIRDEEAVDRLFDRVLEEHGRVDVLVNNAGGQFTAPAEEISDSGWRAVHRLNVDAVWSLTRTVATRSMIARGGGLVVFVGVSPRRGIPGYAHATAARAAASSLATSLAIEWSRFGIRGVSVVPGVIDTEGMRGYGAEAVERWRRTIPLGRLGRPEEVGALIAFLASDGGAYVTGATILVDGGVDAWGLGEPPPVGRGAPVEEAAG
jgi:citronellol/citronellal dehydrogenase